MRAWRSASGTITGPTSSPSSRRSGPTAASFTGVATARLYRSAGHPGPANPSPGPTERRPPDRDTRRPPGTSVARRSLRATSRTRSTASSGGGWAACPANQPRTLRRATASGAPASDAASRGSTNDANAPRRSASPASTRAWRANTGTMSRPAMAEHRGTSSWRIRFRTNRGSSFDGSWTGARPRRRHRSTVSARRRASSGCRGPGRIAASPSTPAPRSRLTSTVSAWSSAVCPVAASGPSTSRRAWRARASRLGPSSTTTRTDSNRAPNRRAAPATTSASAAEPGRRPWSTCTAVTRQPEAAARTSSARESGPPETPQTRSDPGSGKVHRASRALVAGAVGSEESAGPCRRGSDTGDPFRRIADLDQRRQPLGAAPRLIEELGATGVLHGGDEPLTLLVLAELGLHPDQLLEEAGRPPGLLAPLAEHLAEARRAGNGRSTGAVHGDVPVALQQAHQGLDAVEPLELLRRGHQPERAAVPQRVPAGPELLGHPAERLGEP